MPPKQVIDSDVSLASALNIPKEWEQNSENSVISTKDKSQEILEEKYSIFWTPDQNQKEMIKSWDEEFRNKMINAKLKFKENTTELEINWKILIFDKKPLNLDMIRWEDAKKNASINNRKLLTISDFISIFELFKYDYNKAINILKLSPYDMWSDSNYECNDIEAWFVNFNVKTIDTKIKSCPNLHAIYVHI